MQEKLIEGRILAKKKFKHADKLFLYPTDVRFATPNDVAEYRAKNLKCDLIIELGAGVGGQTFYLAKYCKEVIAIDNDDRKLDFLQKNLKILGIKNVKIINANYYDKTFAKSLPKGTIFCDPQREASKSKRSTEEVRELIELYSSKNLVIEIPAQILPKDLPSNALAEYISIRGKLNRLTLYFGQKGIKVVSLPSQNSLENQKSEEFVPIFGSPKKYIYEIDEVIIRSGLLKKLLFDTKAEFNTIKGNENFITSQTLIDSVFLRPLKLIWFGDEKQAKENLKEASKVIIRGKIDPNNYWKIRSEFEKNLNGSKILTLLLGEKAVIAEPIINLKANYS